MSEKRFRANFDVSIYDSETEEYISVSGRGLEEIAKRMNKQQATISKLEEENEQLKIANARWLDKSLQDKQIRYDNTTCKELTRKYLQLKDENEQLKQEVFVYKKAFQQQVQRCTL